MKGPSRKEETQQKSGTLLSYSKDFSKIKSKSPQIPLSFDEAKASCKARKRKERQESISSLGGQERKVIRSNSEERPTQKKYFESRNIRRVSSSEDFQKGDKTITFDKNETKKRDDVVIYDEDYEHEQRRSHERFSKPLLPKSRIFHKSRKPKARMLPKTKFKPEVSHDPKVGEVEQKSEDEVEAKTETFLAQKLEERKERTPSPVGQFSPDIDLTTLHEQVDFSEPLLSCANHEINEDTETLPGLSVASNRLLSSPRNSIIATHRIYLDPDIQQAANFALDDKNRSPLEAKLQKVTKQINAIKKKIRKYEAEFEAKHGHKLSHADKLNDKTIRKLYLELNRMKKEQKPLKNVCPPVAAEPVDAGGRNLQDTLNDIERRLSQKREACNRPSVPEQMSSQQLLDEKVAVQKALLYLESIHGRPDNKEDRDLARPIYDRYRTLKRMLSKGQASQSGNELPTIHEDETMTFEPSFAPQSEAEKTSAAMASTDSSDSDSSTSENLTALSKVELINQHRQVAEDKKELKRRIKVFEMEVEARTGRKMQKDDRVPMESVYKEYKKVKAKLKLLDALVGKQP